MKIRICLNMIVKNESNNILRCLRAVGPYIACWVICDTGSVDGTQAMIRDFFKENQLPGELHEFNFENFSQARNKALNAAKNSKLEFDYIILVDADMEFEAEDAFTTADLTDELYQIVQTSGVSYWNNRLLKRTAGAFYKGVTHEFLNLTQGTTSRLYNARFIDHASGSNRINKFERDANLIMEALAVETDKSMRARYTFYLANSWRDFGDMGKALHYYHERAKMGDWDQEIYVSLYNAAKIKSELNFSTEEVLETYSSASKVCLDRAEALHGAAVFCRTREIYEQCYEYAKSGMQIKRPTDGLFIADWIYEYGLIDEMSIAAFWTGRYNECIALCDKMINEKKVPTDYYERIKNNRQFAIKERDKKIKSIGSAEQCYFDAISAAKAEEGKGLDVKSVIELYMSAHDLLPSRIEALYEAVKLCRHHKMHEEGYDIALKGLCVHPSNGYQGKQSHVDNYAFLDEFSIHAYWTGRFDECVAACEKIINNSSFSELERERVNKNRDFAIKEIIKSYTVALEKKISDLKTIYKNKLENVEYQQSSPAIILQGVPKIFHFITGLDKNFGSKPFNFVHYMAVVSALKINKGFDAIIYYHYEPDGKYWQMIQKYARTQFVDLPREVFGNPVNHFAHKADVLRMQIMLETGGIYLDLDTICQRSFQPLLDNNTVLGVEEKKLPDGKREQIGICNATLIAPPKSEFMKIWYEEYRNFSGGTQSSAWNKFSVQVPSALAKKFPHLLRVEPAESFFWPSWDQEGIVSMFQQDTSYPLAYSFHLWESQSWNFISIINEESVFKKDTTYNRLARIHIVS